MNTTPETTIRAILVKSVIDCALGLPTAWPNMPFDDKPANGAAWMATRILVPERSAAPVTCGDRGENEHVGVLQLDLNFPVGEGEQDVLAKADLANQFYKPGKSIRQDEVTVHFDDCSRTSGREVDGFWRVSVTIGWRARVARG